MYYLNNKSDTLYIMTRKYSTIFIEKKSHYFALLVIT